MANKMNKILDHNDWFFLGTTTLGRGNHGNSNWLNRYWYHYRGTLNSDVFFSDEEKTTEIKWFQIWNHNDEEYTKVGILPTGEFCMYSGSISNHPWGMAPGTEKCCESYTVRHVYEIINDLGLNGYEAMELIALRCACY